MKKIFQRKNLNFLEQLKKNHNLYAYSFYTDLIFKKEYTKKELIRLRNRISLYRKFISCKKCFILIEKELNQYKKNSTYIKYEDTPEFLMSFCWKIKYDN